MLLFIIHFQNNFSLVPSGCGRSGWHDTWCLHEEPREIQREESSCGCLWREHRNRKAKAPYVFIYLNILTHFIFYIGAEVQYK